MIALIPLPGHALVELRDKYEFVATTQQKYDTRTSGICLAVLTNSEPQAPWYAAHLPEKIVFWEEYKTGMAIERDGKQYAFIKIEDLTGYEDV